MARLTLDAVTQRKLLSGLGQDPVTGRWVYTTLNAAEQGLAELPRSVVRKLSSVQHVDLARNAITTLSALAEVQCVWRRARLAALCRVA